MDGVKVIDGDGHVIGAAAPVVEPHGSRGQCYVSFEADEWNLAASARRLGADRILGASDDPHLEYSDHCQAKLTKALEPLDPHERLHILCQNEVEAYGLPIPAAV